LTFRVLKVHLENLVASEMREDRYRKQGAFVCLVLEVSMHTEPTMKLQLVRDIAQVCIHEKYPKCSVQHKI
jgi:hypothetical protein